MRTKPTDRRLAAALCIAAAAALPAAAQPTPSFSFRGYATLGVAGSDNEHADYLIDSFQPDGPGHTRRWSAEPDSRLGLQLSAQLMPRLSAVVQVLAQQRHDDSYRPAVEWANVRYQATPDFAVRAGRVVLPIFLLTDSRRVSYANPWVRPPVELYSLVPVTTNDGVDANYRISGNGLTTTLQVTAGRSDSRFPSSSGFDAGTAAARRLVAASATVERGFALARVSYGQAQLSIAALDPLFSAFRQFGPPGEAIADRYEVRDRKVDFVGVAGTYDPGRWFVMGEWARFDTHSILGAKKAWYVSGGYRFGAFTPYATFARLDRASQRSDPGLPVAGLPPTVAPLAALLNARLNAQLAVVPQQRTLSAGLRWDAFKNVALKAQLDVVRLGDGSIGTFGNVQPGFTPGGTVRIFSATADIIF